MKRSLLLVILATPSWGSIVDQSYLSGGGALGTVINECCKFVAQTYTAGLTGILAGIDIDVGSTTAFPLEVEIRTVAAGIPTSTVLGDTTLSSSSSSLGSLITFSQLIPQVAGSQYAIVVSYPTAPYVLGVAGQGVGSWNGGTGNPYVGGQSLDFFSSWQIQSGEDSHFQTFVDTVPEPSTGLLIFIAAVITPMLRRKVCSRG